MIITNYFQAYKYIFSKPLSIADLSKLRKNILTIFIKNIQTNNIFNLTNNNLVQIANSKEYNAIDSLNKKVLVINQNKNVGGLTYRPFL